MQIQVEMDVQVQNEGTVVLQGRICLALLKKPGTNEGGSKGGYPLGELKEWLAFKAGET
jgi:hypothetical protein